VGGELGPGLREFWQNASWSSLHAVQVGVGGPTVLVNVLTILAVGAGGIALLGGCVEQHYVYGRRGADPKRNIPLSLVLGTGFVLTVYILATAAYMMVLRCTAIQWNDGAGARDFSTRLRIGWARRRWSRFFRWAGRRCMAGAILIRPLAAPTG